MVASCPCCLCSLALPSGFPCVLCSLSRFRLYTFSPFCRVYPLFASAALRCLPVFSGAASAPSPLGLRGVLLWCRIRPLSAGRFWGAGPLTVFVCWLSCLSVPFLLLTVWSLVSFPCLSVLPDPLGVLLLFCPVSLCPDWPSEGPADSLSCIL